jgi:hypothetical protein
LCIGKGENYSLSGRNDLNGVEEAVESPGRRTISKGGSRISHSLTKEEPLRFKLWRFYQSQLNCAKDGACDSSLTRLTAHSFIILSLSVLTHSLSCCCGMP